MQGEFASHGCGLLVLHVAQQLSRPAGRAGVQAAGGLRPCRRQQLARAGSEGPTGEPTGRLTVLPQEAWWERTTPGGQVRSCRGEAQGSLSALGCFRLR